MATDTVIKFHDNPASQTVSSVPHKSEKHLPHFINMVVDKTFCDRFARLYRNESCTCKLTILGTWKKSSSFMKVRKVPSFTKWSKCERQHATLLHVGIIWTDTKVLTAQMDAHIKFVTDERRYHSLKTELKNAQTDEYIYFWLLKARSEKLHIASIHHKNKA